MSNARMMISLHDEDYELLKCLAEGRRIPAARLAARLIEEALAQIGGDGRPGAPLMRWLSVELDHVREAADWPSDITVRLFSRIQDEVPQLYEQALTSSGRAGLNSEIGRLIKERLRARAIIKNDRPHLVRISPAKGALIQAATLLEPDVGDNHA